MFKIFKKLQMTTSKKIKIYLPIILMYMMMVFVTMFAVPNYILAGIITILTIVLYNFICYILEREELLIQEHQEKLDDFHELFVNLSEENEKLSGELEQVFHDFDNHVISSKTDLFGRITYASKALQKISGYTEDEMLGEPHNILRHPDMPKESFKDMWKTIGLNRVWSGEVKNKTKSGGFYWVRAIISPIYDNAGVKIGYNSIRQDITKEKTI